MNTQEQIRDQLKQIVDMVLAEVAKDRTSTQIRDDVYRIIDDDRCAWGTLDDE